MCFLKAKAQTVEQIVAANSVGMTDAQKQAYWWALTQNIFALLGKVDAKLYPITAFDWQIAALAQYPGLKDIKFADVNLQTTDLAGLQEILSRDWTNLIPYTDYHQCANFAADLYSHLDTYYQINAVVEVWGNTDKGYHGFNLAVLKDPAAGLWIARLIEPQLDQVFIDQGPLGKYVPDSMVNELANLNPSSSAGPASGGS